MQTKMIVVLILLAVVVFAKQHNTTEKNVPAFKLHQQQNQGTQAFKINNAVKM